MLLFSIQVMSCLFSLILSWLLPNPAGCGSKWSILWSPKLEKDVLCHNKCWCGRKDCDAQADCWLFAGNYPLLTVWQCHAGSSTAPKRITQGAWHSSTEWGKERHACALFLFPRKISVVRQTSKLVLGGGAECVTWPAGDEMVKDRKKNGIEMQRACHSRIWRSSPPL